MITFHCKRVDKKNNNTPILKDVEIDELAEMLLQDYKPKLLKEPSKINYMHFLESYLGATLEFHDIYYETGDRPILGATAFNDERLKIFDRYNMRTDHIKVNRRTIILDNSVMEAGKEGLALFTGLHEGGHLWLHSGVFAEASGQMPLFGVPEMTSVVYCRREDIERFGSKKSLSAAEQWREHHADYFAAAIAMPKKTFLPLANNILRSEGISGGKVVTGVDRHQDWFAEKEFPRRISEAYGVSKQAASIKLKKCGFIIDQNTLQQQQAQIRLL